MARPPESPSSPPDVQGGSSSRRSLITGSPWRQHAAFVRRVVTTTVYTVGWTGTAALAGVIVARQLGPGGRGEYAAVMAWFLALSTVGELGQAAATCYFVAREPQRARTYVATSRTMVIVSGLVVVAAGMALAPVLGRNVPGLTAGYQIAFAAFLATCVGTTYIAGLQGRDIGRWNFVRVAQPLLFLAWILVLLVSGSFDLHIVLWGVGCTIAAQAALAYLLASRSGLTGGRSERRLVRPLAVYGVSQLLAISPLTINTHLDQLVLSQAVPLADLGRYAVAVSITSLAVPAVAAIGYVAFPRLASPEPVPGGPARLQRLALVGCALTALAVLVPVALLSEWLVPIVFGADFAAAVPLIWILAPGGVFLACGQVAGDLLRGRNRPLTVAWAQGVAAAVTVVLLIALLPSLGVAGAAVASTVAYGSSLLMMVWRLSRLAEDSGTDQPSKQAVAEGVARPDADVEDAP